nr:hypothetical protein Iba_scaffold45480CG0010 [Ipomoea batatas]
MFHIPTLSKGMYRAVQDLGYTCTVEREIVSLKLYANLLAGVHCPPSMLTTKKWWPSICHDCTVSSGFSNTSSTKALKSAAMTEV